jgi:hypothetical protein
MAEESPNTNRSYCLGFNGRFGEETGKLFPNEN